jgi:uncharacterized protein YaaW (UPF0174 family)
MRYYSNNNLAKVIAMATYEELSPIYEQLGMIQSGNYPSKFLAKKICDQGGNKVLNLFKDGEVTSYLEILNQLSTSFGFENLSRTHPWLLKEDDSSSDSYMTHKEIDAIIFQMENLILVSIYEKIYKSMSKDQLNYFFKKIASEFGESDEKTRAKILATGGVLAIGNIGGFATYTAMSSLLSVASGGALGFGAYTAASSVLSIVLGPVGWMSLGIYALYKAGSPKLNKMLPIIICVALIRRKYLT